MRCRISLKVMTMHCFLMLSISVTVPLVEIDDLRAVLADARHAVALDHDGRDDGVADLAGRFAEGADHLHHADDRAPGGLSGLLVGEVGVRGDGACGESAGE
jgi:hypothetical protein